MKTTCLSIRSGLERESRLAKANSNRLGMAPRSAGQSEAWSPRSRCRSAGTVSPNGGVVGSRAEEWADGDGSAEGLGREGDGAPERECAALWLPERGVDRLESFL